MGERSEKPSRRVTVSDVARLSGVSRATVSYVLNDAPNQTIPPATRQRVREAAAELGYTRSAAAVALRRGHSNIVLIVKDAALSGYITEPFIAAISERLRDAGHTPLTTDYTSDEALVALAGELGLFGVLSLAAVGAEVGPALEKSGVRRQYHSFGSRGEQTVDDERRPWEEEIGRAQVAHLSESGPMRMVYALPHPGSPRTTIARARARGAMGEYRRRTGEEMAAVVVGRERAEAREQIALLRSDAGEPRRLGVCCFDDVVAASVLAAALDSGIGVPDALSVIGVDDTPFAALMSPALSTVRVDSVLSGRRVAERFLGVDLDGGDAPAIEIVARATTAQVAAPPARRS
ncbi:LacI family DNA-binding transcriptional regulator [Microbacterium betulae]|uniref:LacI family DNA-binding transcriptional regulator n=1 Tax=Microbacterium betulae TaxID=2981139 RepID=A0AA97FJ08_9MICO|nr:LacI family DNA-binding transcriptional regulator [Microbacterium sp. AB]WOF23165.1 LacI family DNA-binding transcriptional regulator [Microbacterium sp. AB]